jgi:uncharacterized iron-regulated membrane protein
MLVLLGGLVLVLEAVLGYLAMWRREDRGDGAAGSTGSPQAGGHGRAPLVLILTAVGLGLFGVIYTVVMIFYPPKW